MITCKRTLSAMSRYFHCLNQYTLLHTLSSQSCQNSRDIRRTPGILGCHLSQPDRTIMLLTITCEAERATDLGYLHKNPGSWFGSIRIFYPEADDRRCTAVLLLDVDPIGLVRRSNRRALGLDQYVNDRPAIGGRWGSTSMSMIGLMSPPAC